MRIAIELIRDFAQRDPSAFHRFLWSNHLAYADGFDLRLFEPGRLGSTRERLLDLMCRECLAKGIEPARDVHSVLDVGCSTGYLLRHAETSVFTSATTLVGIDIDEHAVQMGSRYLRAAGSRIELVAGAMEELDGELAERTFDAALCCGSLLYLDESEARSVVDSLLRHTTHVVGLIGLAHPDRDNRLLEHSTVRSFDACWIHNFDAMVQEAGGTLRSRQWVPPSDPTARGVYMVVATPGRSRSGEANGHPASGER
jgi:SAM-dependent methyltransferase